MSDDEDDNWRDDSSSDEGSDDDGHDEKKTKKGRLSFVHFDELGQLLAAVSISSRLI